VCETPERSGGAKRGNGTHKLYAGVMGNGNLFVKGNTNLHCARMENDGNERREMRASPLWLFSLSLFVFRRLGVGCVVMYLKEKSVENAALN
jgi:hypothetical protein